MSTPRGRDQSGPATISVLSYNLKDYGKSAAAIRRQQHELLRFQRPDVLCLQESGMTAKT